MKNSIGVIGSGVMGSALAKNFMNKGYKVSAFDTDMHKLSTLYADSDNKIDIFTNQSDFVNSLELPRKIILMVPAGEIVDIVINSVKPFLSKNDIIMDGGNSFFKDTNHRFDELQKDGIIFFGVGISGGEEGALNGPSIMPGGLKEHYPQIKDLLESISAKKDGVPCCSYIGNQGAGHFIKMVHNGIEYADMQLISEIYIFLKQVLHKSNAEISDIFTKWNNTELKSYLLEISAIILKEKDSLTPSDIIDVIKDSASNKGTGKWTSIESFELSSNVSMITASLQSRIISNDSIVRYDVSNYMHLATENKSDISLDSIQKAYYLAKIIAYTQGFAMMFNGSKEYNWNINLENVACTFKAGCIIQAEILERIGNIYKNNADLENLLLDNNVKNIMYHNLDSLKEFNINAINCNIATPAISSALTYINQLSMPLLGANMVQAQRDLFGAHTFNRTDREGVFHHDWQQL